MVHNMENCIFTLMNKDVKIAELYVTDSKTSITKVFGRMPQGLDDIQTWIDRRTSPFIRKNIEILLKYNNIHNKQEFLFRLRAISLNDTLWVNNSYNSTTWDKVSSYRNRLSKIISQVALDCSYTGGNLNFPSPDYKLDGTADKCWKRVNGEICLYKTDGEKWSGITGNRAYCEYYASQVAEQLGLLSYTKYNLKSKMSDSGCIKAYAISKLFTSEEIGYLPIGNTKFDYIGLEELDQLMNNSTRSRIILREMLVLDSIIANFDRHSGNYGFLVNNDTFNIMGMAPIFDNDCSLGPYTSLHNKTIDKAYNEAISKAPKTVIGKGGYIEQAKWAMTDKLRNNIKNMYPFKFNRIGGAYDLEEERLNFMEFIVNSQIKRIVN